MPFRTISFLPLGFVLGISMLPLSAQERPVDPTSPFRITPPSENWLAGVTIDPPWDKGPYHRDGLPYLPPRHDTTLLSGGGLPQDNARTFEYLKKQARIDKDLRVQFLDLDVDMDALIQPAGADEGKDNVERVRDQLSREGYQAFREDPKKPVDERTPKNAYRDKPSDGAPQQPGEKKRLWSNQKYRDPNEIERPHRPWSPRPFPAPPAGRPGPMSDHPALDPEHRIHQLEKELEASHRREAVLRGVVKDLIEIGPPSAAVVPPASPPNTLHGKAWMVYLEAVVSEILHKDLKGAYRQYKKANKWFESAASSAPAHAMPDIMKFQQKCREALERLRSARGQRPKKDKPSTQGGKTPRFKDRPAQPAAAEGAPPAPPVPLKDQTKEAREASQIYLQGHLMMKDGSELEKKKDFAGAYFKLRDARDLFDKVFDTDPAWQPEIVEYRRANIREMMERVRQLEIKKRGVDSPLTKDDQPDRAKDPASLPPPGGPPAPPPPPDSDNR